MCDHSDASLALDTGDALFFEDYAAKKDMLNGVVDDAKTRSQWKHVGMVLKIRPATLATLIEFYTHLPYDWRAVVSAFVHANTSSEISKTEVEMRIHIAENVVLWSLIENNKHMKKAISSESLLNSSIDKYNMRIDNSVKKVVDDRDVFFLGNKKINK